MILVQDNFLQKNVFDKLHSYIKDVQFNIVKVGEKDFLVTETPKEIIPFFTMKDLDLNLSFIRKAHSDFDIDLRIHADNIINGRKTIYASVLYLNKKEDGVSKNGTMFYKHKEFGYELNSENEIYFDEIITKHSNNPTLWEEQSFVASRPNRLLTYSADMFHSKYPQKITNGERVVLVNFYSEKNDNNNNG